jgi:predicted Zn-dependent protease
VIKLPKKKYTPKQDVQLGKEAASEVRKQYPIIEDQHIAKYLTQIGNRLVAAAPTELKQSVYEYSFTPVNLKDINAFALPGGPMFVQRGMFDAAAEEAEVAGVMAHELSRVLLRHGTANASKAQNPWLQLGQIAGAVGGAVVGGELGGYIAEGTQFGLGTLLHRYSRDYEKQADLLGAQIMARAGYDPRALAHAPSRSASIRLNKTATWFQMALFWSTNSIRIQGVDVPMLLGSSNWSDSRQRLQSGLCLGFANSLPLAVGAMVFEVCQIGVLRREQPVFLDLGLRP